MAFTPKQLTELKAEISAALKDLEARHNIKIGWARGSYDTDGHATLKMELTQNGAPDRMETDYRFHAPSWGIPADTFGKQFSTASGTYEICGIAPKARSMPILAKKVGGGPKNGLIFKFAAEAVQRALGIERPTYGGYGLQQVDVTTIMVPPPPRS